MLNVTEYNNKEFIYCTKVGFYLIIKILLDSIKGMTEQMKKRLLVRKKGEALASVITELAHEKNVAIAIFDPKINLVAETSLVEAQTWTRELSGRVHAQNEDTYNFHFHKNRRQMDIWPMGNGTAAAVTQMWIADDLIGYFMIGGFYCAPADEFEHAEQMNGLPVLDVRQIGAIIDSGKERVYSLFGMTVGTAPSLLDSVEEFIAFNLNRRFSYDFLGKHLHEDPDVIRQLFKEKIKMPLATFVSFLREKAAQDLLVQTDLSAAEVAKRVGLTEEQLRKDFHLFSNSPEEYRQEARAIFKKKIPIVFVTNENYVTSLCAALTSLNCTENRKGEEYVFIIMHTGLSLKSMLWLAASGESLHSEVRFFNLEDELRPYEKLFDVHGHYTKETYYRLYIPNVLGKFFDRVLYLDADVVSTMQNFAGIYAEAEPSKTINAALNYSTEADVVYIESLGLDPKTYINAGVMVIDCKRYIRADYFEKAIECLSACGSYRYVDQDVLNLICAGDIGILDSAWNFQWNNAHRPERYTSYIREIVAKTSSPNFIHYTFEKPWQIMLNEHGMYYWIYASLACNMAVTKEIFPFR